MATLPPHVDALDPRYEMKPTTPRSPHYEPFNGIQYKVKDGDTIANIAERSGYSAKYIMNFAFGTTDPREVNWYLRMRVGCKKLGPAKCNFAFSKSAEPGVIWLPRQAYIRLTKKPKPKPQSFSVSGSLPRYVQRSSNVCWGAAVANIYDWKKKPARRSATDALYEIGTEWGDKYKAGGFMTGPDFKRLAKSAGLRGHKTGHFFHDEYWIDTLRSRGCIIMLQKAYDDWTHWIMLCGYEVTPDGRLHVTYLDPGDGRKWSQSADALYDKLLDARTKTYKAWSF